MDSRSHNRDAGQRFTCIAVAIFLHAILVYAMVTGMARDVAEVIRPPIEVMLIEEVLMPKPNLPLQHDFSTSRSVSPSPGPRTPVARFSPSADVRMPQSALPAIRGTVVSYLPPENPAAEAAPLVEALSSIPASAAMPGTAPLHIPAVVDAKACEKPEYPRKSLRNQEQGIVTVAFLIGIDGRVADSRIDKSSGFRELDNAARAGLSLCKFQPGTIDGKPQQSWTKMQYVWALE